jgi:cardiolipin synthase
MRRTVQHGSVYPWRDDTRCELLVDPQVFMPVMLESVRTARSYILLEMYLVESGLVTSQLLDTVLDAADRGVRIFIILDSFGSRLLNSTDRDRLKHANILISNYHPFRWLQMKRNLIRDHRKLLLVDGRFGYTGGIGLSDGIRMADKSRLPWHDVVVRFEGSIALDWQELFSDLWQRLSTPLDITSLRPPAATGGSARLVSSQPTRINPIYAHLRQRAALAKQRVWVATAYFLPSWRLLRVLQHAAARGVDVRLLLPGTVTDNPAVRYASQRFYLRLLKAGVRIYEYQPSFMHAKAALVDHWASVGSSNFDRWSMSRNLEANLEVSDERFASSIEQMLKNDFARSVEISLDDWLQRPRKQHWREQLWGTIEDWMDRR